MSYRNGKCTDTTFFGTCDVLTLTLSIGLPTGTLIYFPRITWLNMLEKCSSVTTSMTINITFQVGRELIEPGDKTLKP